MAPIVRKWGWPFQQLLSPGVLMDMTRGVGVLVCVWALWGCSPAMNWREVRPADAGLVALMPCKPEGAQRDLVMAGQSLTLHMLSCDTAGLTFAMGAMRLPDGLAAADVQRGWRLASLTSLKADPAAAQAWSPVLPKGVSGQGWQADGLRHDGTRVRAHVLALAHGNEVFQLAVYGDASPEVLASALEGVRLDAVNKGAPAVAVRP
jgi:hypothetical protein